MHSDDRGQCQMCIGVRSQRVRTEEQQPFVDQTNAPGMAIMAGLAAGCIFDVAAEQLDFADAAAKLVIGEN